jgi:hypothetical protein
MKKLEKKKYLLTRFGGIGDVAPVMAVAKYLKNLGHTVHLALREDEQGSRQVDLLENTNSCDLAMTFKEIGPWKTRCVSFKHGWVDVRSIYQNYDEVVDYMRIIENNDTCNSSFQKSPMDEWKKHRNSNWVNWYDLHFSWANINPESVPKEEKRPVYKLSTKEYNESISIRANYSGVVVINTTASSLSRTWYQSDILIQKILDEYKNILVINWNQKKNVWEEYTKETKNNPKVYLSPFKSKLRASMCVVNSADTYIGSDTGFTHIAEGLGVKHIAIYSSVPWWTRAAYYKNQVCIDKGYYSFCLTLGDPFRVKEGIDGLSKKEKTLLGYHKKGLPIEEAAKNLNTTPDGVELELTSIIKKIESFDRIQSKSLSEVSVEEVLAKLNELLTLRN